MDRRQYYEKLAEEHRQFRETPTWQLFRKMMLANRNCQCEFCGKTYRNTKWLDVHHMYATNYENLDPSRFMVLCKTCHKFLHSKSGTPLLGKYTDRVD